MSKPDIPESNAKNDPVRITGEALELPAADRRSFVEARCAGDGALRDEVLSLIEADSAAGKFLDEPALGQRIEPETLNGEPEASLPTLKGYDIIRRIGAGGMGSVYQAEQHMPRRTVAIKIIRPGTISAQSLSRFEHEAHVLGLLQHPGIAQIHEAGTLEGEQPFFSMEYIEGESLLEHAASKQLDTDQRLELMAQVCDAVHYAHQRGVIHRDLKPGNILVDREGQPKIVDFGVARLTDADIQITAIETRAGQLIGTIPYMSPEQIKGDRDAIDIRSDVYALGVVLYELLVGRHPYDLKGKTIPEAVRIIGEEDALPLSSISRLYRGDIETIVGTAITKEQDRRYGSVAEMAADLRRYLNNEPIQARPASGFYQLRKFARRNRTLVGAAAIIAMLLVTGIISTSMGWNRAVRAEADATSAEAEAVRAEAEALRELTRANAVVALIDDLFSSADPHERKGPDYTVRQLLDDFEGTIGDQFEGQPLVEASIRHIVGHAYRGLELSDEAERHLQAALDLQTHELGQHDPFALKIRLDLIYVHHDRGEYAEVERKIRAFLEQVAVVEDLDWLQQALTNELADVLRHQGRYEEAEPLFVKNLETTKRVMGDEHRNTLVSMNSLATLYKDQGRYDEAEKLYLQGLEIRKRIQGDEHLDTLTSMNNLADTLIRQGRYKEAESLQIKALEIQKRVVGVVHPNTLTFMFNLANVYRSQGRYDEAEPLYLETLEIQRRVLGDEHSSTLSCMGNLAILYYQQGRYDEAEPLYLKTVEISNRVRGEEHKNTLGTTTNLGNLYLSMKRFDDARAMFEISLPAKRRVLGMDHPWTRIALRGLARAYDGLELNDDALPLWREYQEFLVEQAEDPDASVQKLNSAAWDLLTNVHSELRDPARALPLAQRALDKVVGHHKPGVLDTLALAQHLTGDTAAAIKTQRRVVELQPNDKSLAETLARYEAALQAGEETP